MSIYMHRCGSKETFAIRALFRVANARGGLERSRLVHEKVGISESTQYRVLQQLLDEGLLKEETDRGYGRKKKLFLADDAQDMIDTLTDGDSSV
jgi:transposase